MDQYDKTATDWIKLKEKTRSYERRVIPEERKKERKLTIHVRKS